MGDLAYDCSPSDLVPSGVGYGLATIANQVWAARGGVAGESIVRGADYMAETYLFNINHL
jgi:hypothetical protein